MLGGGYVTVGPGGSFRFTTQLPDLVNGEIGAPIVVDGNITATKDLNAAWGLSIDSLGTLRLNGHRISTFNVSSAYGTLIMDDPRDSLITTHASFFGVENLSAGTMSIGGDLTI